MARILFLAYTTYESDGRVKRQAEALAACGHQVDVICLDSGRGSDTQAVNVIRLPLRRYRGSSNLKYVANYANFLVRATITAVRRHLKARYDLAIACTMPDVVVLCALPLKLTGTKVLFDMHDTMPELYLDKFPGKAGKIGALILQMQERVCAMLADHVLAVHEPHRARLVAAGIPQRKITVVMNSPDTRIFRLRPIQSSDGFTLVCHGTLTRRLGLEVVLEALARLRDRIPNLKFNVIGEGDYKATLESKVRELGLEGVVTFYQCVPLEQLPALLASADLGVVPNLPSHASHLMLPVKLLEYATLGIPVVASRLRTVEYYFGENAVRYFTPGSPTELAQAIEELYHAPGLRSALAARAYATAKRFSWPSERSKLYQLVDTLLGTKSATANKECRLTLENDELGDSAEAKNFKRGTNLR